MFWAQDSVPNRNRHTLCLSSVFFPFLCFTEPTDKSHTLECLIRLSRWELHWIWTLSFSHPVCCNSHTVACTTPLYKLKWVHRSMIHINQGVLVEIADLFRCNWIELIKESQLQGMQNAFVCDWIVVPFLPSFLHRGHRSSFVLLSPTLAIS